MPLDRHTEMIFVESELADAYVSDPEPRRDERGPLARTFCEQEFAFFCDARRSQRRAVENHFRPFCETAPLQS